MNNTDPTGMVVKGSRNGNQVRLTWYMRYVDTAGRPIKDQQLTGRLNKAISEKWSGKFGKYNVVALATTPLGKTSSDHINTITVKEGVGRSEVFMPLDKGTFYTKASDGDIGHEAGHLAGLEERYDDITGKSFEGFGENVMGSDTSSSPSEDNITAILNGETPGEALRSAIAEPQVLWRKSGIA